MAGLLRLFGENIVLRLVELKVVNGFDVVMGVRFLQSLRDRLRDGVLDTVDVQVM
jgi:hypothetical protein